MKSENNGKIAIAIVAMFVVALSVVGFTYAYFTAQVRGNTAVSSAKVTAGRLQVVYSSGDQLIAQNIVPGWISDNKHYYDPVYSKYGAAESNGTTTYKIKAVSTDDRITCNVTGSTPLSQSNQAISACDGAVTSPGTADGKIGPVTFSVANDTPNTGDTQYAITLTNISNSIVDTSHLYVSLYVDDTWTWSGNLAASGTQVIGSAQGITKNGSAKNYKVYLTYQNDKDADQDDSQDVSVQFKVKVIGISNNGGSTYYDEDGNVITFPESTATEPALEVSTTVSAG